MSEIHIGEGAGVVGRAVDAQNQDSGQGGVPDQPAHRQLHPGDPVPQRTVFDLHVFHRQQQGDEEQGEDEARR